MAPIPYYKMHVLKRPDVSPTKSPKIHDSCQSDLDKLYPTDLQQKVLKAQIKKRLEYFQSHSSDFCIDNAFFEPYKSVNDHGTQIPVFVMRFNKIKLLSNLRIFFVVESNEIHLIHAFQEKGKKTYDPAYEVVKARLS